MSELTTVIHPDAVLDAMLTANVHPTKRRNLTLIQKVCQERHQLGSNDFSLKAVGEAVNARGGLKPKALWNAQSADYRKLIEAWQAYASPILGQQKTEKRVTPDALTRSIADPAARIIVEQVVRERNALRAEVNILKAQTSITIDRRSAVANRDTTTADGATFQRQAALQLNVLEREALAHAISSELWESEGWAEEKHGRVVTAAKGSARPRTIFKPGFVSAVRRILTSK